MLQRKVRKHQAGSRSDWFGFPEHLPVRSELPELTSESFLDLAVILPGRVGRKDGIARPELEFDDSLLQETGRPQTESLAPGEVWHEGAEGATIQDRSPEERERSGDLEDGVQAPRPSGDGTEEPAQLRVSDECPGVALDLQGHAGGSEEQRLRQGEISPERQLRW